MPFSKSCFVFFLTFFAGFSLAAEDPILSAPKALSFQGGGDIRIRQESFDSIPLPTESPRLTRGGENHYLRFRTRLFGQASLRDRLSLNIRLTSELRNYWKGNNSAAWPDELILDNLSLKLRFQDASYLVLGRQDSTLGSGRLFNDGTPMDGSRSAYFNGLSSHLQLTDAWSLKLFSFYQSAKDPLVIGNVNRTVVGYDSSANSLDEATAGFFLNYASTKQPIQKSASLYYLWKHETAWRSKAQEDIPTEELHVLGATTLIRTENFRYDLEFATEFSPNSSANRHGIFAYLDAQYAPQSLPNSAHLGCNVLYFSGDDPETSDRNEAFNPLFARSPWISELLIFTYDGEGSGNWNNLIYANAHAGLSFWDAHQLRVSAGYVGAEENNGAGGGNNRGWLYTARYDFPLLAGNPQGRGKLAGYLLAEILDPGDYYCSQETAYFLRLHLNFNF